MFQKSYGARTGSKSQESVLIFIMFFFKNIIYLRKKIEDKIREAKEKVRETKRDFLEK